MLGWLIASWAALFVVFAGVTGILGDASAAESAVSIARDLIIAAAILLAAGYALNHRQRRS